MKWGPPAKGTTEHSRAGNQISGQGGVRRRENKYRGGQKEKRAKDRDTDGSPLDIVSLQ